LSDVAVLSIKDSGGTYREIDFTNYVHVMSDGEFYDIIRVHTRNYKNSTKLGTTDYLYEFLDAKRDAKLVIGGTQFFQGVTRSKGKIQADGSIVIELLGLGWDITNEEVNIDIATATDNEAVVTAILAGKGFTVNTPAGSEVAMGGYSINAKRGVALREMIADFNFALYFEYDSEVYYEPKGYYSSGETLNTASDNIKVLSWEKNQIDVIVNKVIVQGTASDGTKYSETRTDATSISNYGEHFGGRITVDYLTSATDAQNIGDQLLKPDPGEGGTIQLFWYKDRLVNETLSFTDASRGISGTFIVRKQVNYYPERTSVLTLGDARDNGILNQNQRELELRRARAKLLTSATTDVGGQGFSGQETALDDVPLSGGVDTDTAIISGSISEGDADITGGIQGVVTELGYNSSQYDESVISDIDTNTWTDANSSYTTSSSYDYLFHAVFVNFYFRALEVAVGYDSYDVYVRLKNEDTSQYFPSSGGVLLLERMYYQEDNVGTSMMEQIECSTLLFAPFNWKNDTLTLQYKLNSGESNGITVTADMRYQYFGSRGHTHDDNIADGGHDHNDTFADSGHDHPDDLIGNDHDHDLDGAVTESKNVDIVAEDKTDR